MTASTGTSADGAPAVSSLPPLCVDLDGTLVRTDTLVEAALELLRRRPWALLIAAMSLGKGRARFKSLIQAPGCLDVKSLPYNREVVQLVREARLQGRKTLLVTASSQTLAEEIATYLSCFDEVHGSRDDTNLKGERKAEFLVEKFGRGGFDYAGDSEADIPVWRAARQGITVVEKFSHLAGASMTALEPEAPTMPFWKLAFKAGRAHQWAKNALVAVPLLTSHKFAEPRLLFATLIAIASLSCLASATYILNDLLDIESDRLHPSKRRRPIASGAISLSRAILLGMGYVVVGALLASLLPRAAIALLALYIICTLSYSFYLKRKLLIDVLVLAGLYTMRVLLGGGATRIPISFWLLVFSIFVFVSLALAKRAIELGGGGAQPANSRRAYMSSDLQALAAVGASSGVAATLVLALYLHSPEVRALYPQPALLWLLCPLFLYWFGRLWVMIARKWVDDDPVVFLLHDRASRITGIAALVVVILATLARDLPLTWITR